MPEQVTLASNWSVVLLVGLVISSSQFSWSNLESLDFEEFLRTKVSETIAKTVLQSHLDSVCNIKFAGVVEITDVSCF